MPGEDVHVRPARCTDNGSIYDLHATRGRRDKGSEAWRAAAVIIRTSQVVNVQPNASAENISGDVQRKNKLTLLQMLKSGRDEWEVFWALNQWCHITMTNIPPCQMSNISKTIDSMFNSCRPWQCDLKTRATFTLASQHATAVAYFCAICNITWTNYSESIWSPKRSVATGYIWLTRR